jgi:hypothetical protein
MAQHEYGMRDYRTYDTDSGMVRAERIVALLFALAAAAYGIVGVLRGFGIIGAAGVNLEATGLDGEGTALPAPFFWDAMLWLTAGIAAGIVAWAFAGGRAHLMAETRSAMRWVAYLMVALTAGLIGLALLLGFGLINEAAAPTDGLIWAVAAAVSAALSAAAYSAVPEAVADEDYLVSLVESRARRDEVSGPAVTRRETSGTG